MIAVKIITIVLGLAFLLFGYFIYYKKQYHLINDFQAEREAGRKDERYAERVGRIEFVIGVVLRVIGVLLMLFA